MQYVCRQVTSIKCFCLSLIAGKGGKMLKKSIIEHNFLIFFRSGLAANANIMFCCGCYVFVFVAVVRDETPSYQRLTTVTCSIVNLQYL